MRKAMRGISRQLRSARLGTSASESGLLADSLLRIGSLELPVVNADQSGMSDLRKWSSALKREMLADYRTELERTDDLEPGEEPLSPEQIQEVLDEYEVEEIRPTLTYMRKALRAVGCRVCNAPAGAPCEGVSTMHEGRFRHFQRINDSRSRSVWTVSGGAPGLGKRH